MQGIDLHTHSNISDGALSPEDLLQFAHQKAIHTLALTDHDSMDGIHRANLVAKQQQINLISGVEISSQWHRPNTKKSYGVHIVALNMQNPEPLEQLLTQQKMIRAQRAKEICHKLYKVTAYDALDDVLAMVDGHADRITRSHIAQALYQKKLVNRLQTAFDVYLKQGKPAYVALQWVDMAQVITTIKQSQGFSILAHPAEYDLSATNTRYMIDLFAHLGGDAVELSHANKPLSTRQMIDRSIAQHQLKVSVGSDFHGEHMPWRVLGQVPCLTAQQVGIWELFSP